MAVSQKNTDADYQTLHDSWQAGAVRVDPVGQRMRLFARLALASQVVAGVAMAGCVYLGYSAREDHDDTMVAIAAVGFVGALLSMLIVAILRVIWRQIMSRIYD